MTLETTIDTSGNIKTAGTVTGSSSPSSTEALNLYNTGEVTVVSADDLGTSQVAFSVFTSDGWTLIGASDTGLVTTLNNILDDGSGRALAKYIDKGGTVFNVVAYGATGNGSTDDSTSIQDAITAAGDVGGTVFFPPGWYCCKNTLTLPQNVKLKGAVAPEQSNLPYQGASISSFAMTSFIVIDNSTPADSFITGSSGGSLGSAAIEDLGFMYGYVSSGDFQDNNPPTNSTPNTYGPTIDYNGAIRIRRCTFVNSYIAIRIGYSNISGRCLIEDCMIGSYLYGIWLDYTEDNTCLSNIHMWPFAQAASHDGDIAGWDTINSWIWDNGTGLYVARADDLQINNLSIYGMQHGINLQDTTQAELSPECGTGWAANVDLDTCYVGIYAKSNNSGDGGWGFTNLKIVASAQMYNYGESYTGIQCPTGGSQSPTLNVFGGWVGGTFSAGTLPGGAIVNSSSATIETTHWLGYD